MVSLGSSPETASNRQRMAKLNSYNRTDAGNAEIFALLHGDKFRYDRTRGKWRLWNGQYWVSDKKGEASRAALDVARQRLAAAIVIADKEERGGAIKWAMKSESVYGRRATLESAQSLVNLATIADDYDRDPFLLTVGNGTIDLRTGHLRPSQPDDLITRATDVDFFRAASCSRWLQFLEEIFGGDDELITFISRAVGYSLSGDTREQCLFILWGGGANGKSTFLETLLQLAGSHAAITPFSSFLIQRSAGSPRNDVAKLHGARLVKAAESQKEGALDEAIIKEVTGGDTISARFLFQEFFEFKPTFKLWLATNHCPSIRGTDDAIWRRIRLIPFTRQFSGRNRDLKLLETLRGELSGILAWAVRGCLEWQRTGLGSSPVVETATLEYRRESDLLGRFMKERCMEGPKEHVAGKELYQGYVDFCAANGEKPESNNIFAKALGERGIAKKRSRQGTVYKGIGLVLQASRVKLVESR
jgi:putative DNA primase/helicase